jgi:amidase
MERPADPLAGVDRRTFLRCGALGTALIAGSPSEGAHAAEPSGRTPAAVPEFELEEASIGELQDRMARGEHTALSLAKAYLARIDALDTKGPALRAVIERNPDALAIAAGLDAERKAGRVRGPLHGIPILIKDNIDTADRMTTTAGSLALEGSIAARDAFIVQRLREAGAVLLGKTNLSEWANFRSTHSTSGWSGRGGLCRNPYVLDRNTSGSSSGTGAGIAANFATIGIGTETDGSIVSPASQGCLVGVKPTLGLVSRSGIIPIAHSQDTSGPMTRTVRDAAILLSALCGVDDRDPATKASAGKGADFTKFLDPNGLKGARIGVPRKKLFGYSDVTDRLAEQALAVLKAQGAVLVDPANLTTLDPLNDPEFEVLLYEFKADLNKYLAALAPAARVHSLADVIAFNDSNKDREMPFFGQEIMQRAQKKGPLTQPAYLKARRTCLRLSRTMGIDAVIATHKLDALVMPTDSPAWITDLLNGDHFLGGSSTIAAVAGYPHITVPGGFAHGLPVGISFIGPAWSEPMLFKLAYAYEQATKHRAPPKFLQTALL